MLKFGRKVSYRPLLFSFTIATIVGLLFGLNISRPLGLEVGTIMFLMIVLGHYVLVLPIIFNYWTVGPKSIRYSDIKSVHKRIFSIIFPTRLPFKTIQKDEIRRISIVGLPRHRSSLSSELVVSEEGGFMYNLLFMINEPVKVKLTMDNNSTIDLDLSRDYVQHPHETLGKLQLFLNEFNPVVLHISDETRRAINA